MLFWRLARMQALYKSFSLKPLKEAARHEESALRAEANMCATRSRAIERQLPGCQPASNTRNHVSRGALKRSIRAFVIWINCER